MTENLTEDEIIEKLSDENEEFRGLVDKHRELDQAIAELDKKKYLSAEEDFHRKELQRKKLLKKDRIAEMIRSYKDSNN